MSNPTVTIEFTKDEARRLLAGLQTTASIAGDCALPEGGCEEGASEFGAIEVVDQFIGQLRTQLEG
jgi:hypothetical protein